VQFFTANLLAKDSALDVAPLAPSPAHN
jgi:hypothetical protein